jgi:hypothetical protein
MTMAGSLLLTLGILVFLIRLLVALVWYASGAIIVAGAIMLVVGWLCGMGNSR